MFQINGKKQDPLVLPDAAGPPVTLSEKVYVPIKEYPDVSISTFAAIITEGHEIQISNFYASPEGDFNFPFFFT